MVDLIVLNLYLNYYNNYLLKEASLNDIIYNFMTQLYFRNGSFSNYFGATMYFIVKTV